VINIHHNAEFYPNPDQFIPERWFDATQFGEPITFLGFGSGIRSCFGKKLAVLSMKMILYVLLKVRSFSLLLA
jgi:cytochrome P450 family 135